MIEVTEARYAKGQKLVRCHKDGTGFKTKADRLCEAVNGRWTHREGGYIMSPTKAAKVARLLAEGWDASIFGTLEPPKGAAS